MLWIVRTFLHENHTVAPVISSVVRSSPVSANVSFSILEIPDRMEVSFYIADGTTTVDEVTI